MKKCEHCGKVIGGEHVWEQTAYTIRMTSSETDEVICGMCLWMMHKAPPFVIRSREEVGNGSALLQVA